MQFHLIFSPSFFLHKKENLGSWPKLRSDSQVLNLKICVHFLLSWTLPLAKSNIVDRGFLCIWRWELEHVPQIQISSKLPCLSQAAVGSTDWGLEGIDRLRLFQEQMERNERPFVLLVLGCLWRSMMESYEVLIKIVESLPYRDQHLPRRKEECSSENLLVSAS